MSPQLKSFLKELLIDLTENHNWDAWDYEMENEDDQFVFEVAEKHAHLVDPVDWKFNRAREIRYEMRKLTEELEKL